MNTVHGKSNSFVLDTSVFFTFIEDEDGADMVQSLLDQAKRGQVNLFISFVSFTEVFYIIKALVIRQLVSHRAFLRLYSNSQARNSGESLSVLHLVPVISHLSGIVGLTVR